jgi:hypothetical protein
VASEEATPSWHEASAHTVPAAYRRQLGSAASPLHPLLSNPQLAAPSSGHSLSGSVLSTTGAHVPSGSPVLSSMQASHEPVQLATQQTPSSVGQKPLSHCA